MNLSDTYVEINNLKEWKEAQECFFALNYPWRNTGFNYFACPFGSSFEEKIFICIENDKLGYTSSFRHINAEAKFISMKQLSRMCKLNKLNAKFTGI